MEGLKLLLWKNWKIQSRNKVQTVIEILIPVSCAFLYGILRLGIVPDNYPEPTFYDAFSLDGNVPSVMRECCNEIYYTPNPNPFIDELMRRMNQDYFLRQGLNYTCEGLFYLQTKK